MKTAWRPSVSGVMVAAIAAIALLIYFSGRGCVPTREFRYLAPDGATEAKVAIATCRADTEVAVDLTDGGKTYMLFLASSPAADPSIELQWSSPSLLELHYPGAMQVRLPPEVTEVRNFFGKTEVIYKAR